MYQTLISTNELKNILNAPDTVIIDCRFSLADTGAGYRDYLASHIPNAHYAHLDRDLSSEVIRGKTGRHPFPNVEVFAKKCGEWGIDENAQVIVYDHGGGGIAARLWFLLKWLGHEQVAVLDGGWKHWLGQKMPVSDNIPLPSQKVFHPKEKTDALVSVKAIERMINDEEFLLIDSRAAERYSGEIENIDPIAGHIPSAVSAPFMENLNENGIFRSKNEIKERFKKIVKSHPIERTVFYCGSGVTACHNLLALHHIGISNAKLFPGSWSEWIANGKRPIEIGH